RNRLRPAKVNGAEARMAGPPGVTLRDTAHMERLDATGAATRGVIELIRHGASGPASAEEIGRVDLMFSHIDRNRAGLAFPEHNFVFTDSFRMLLHSSGLDASF